MPARTQGLGRMRRGGRSARTVRHVRIPPAGGLRGIGRAERLLPGAPPLGEAPLLKMERLCDRTRDGRVLECDAWLIGRLRTDVFPFERYAQRARQHAVG